jgi:hypothetical protein
MSDIEIYRQLTRLHINGGECSLIDRELYELLSPPPNILGTSPRPLQKSWANVASWFLKGRFEYFPGEVLTGGVLEGDKLLCVP